MSTTETQSAMARREIAKKIIASSQAEIVQIDERLERARASGESTTELLKKRARCEAEIDENREIVAALERLRIPAEELVALNEALYAATGAELEAADNSAAAKTRCNELWAAYQEAEAAFRAAKGAHDLAFGRAMQARRAIDNHIQAHPELVDSAA